MSLTPFVRPFVMKEFFFGLKSYNDVLRKSKGCFIEVSRMLQAIVMGRKFQGCFKKASGVFQGCFEGVLKKLGFFKEVLWMIQGRFRGV